MIAIAVDDEPLMLGALTKAIKASSDITSVADFTSCEDALDFVQSNPADIAFLDINMRGMGGLSLAEKILAACPDCRIIFCTGHEEYAIQAFRLHASGYLLKPIDAADVQTEIDNIKRRSRQEKPLTVKCFGNFEAYVNGKRLSFKRTKTKELLAFFVDRNGAGVTISEIGVALWEDDKGRKQHNYIHQLLLDLRRSLEEEGVDHILQQSNYSYSVDPEKIDCDYFSYLKTGKPQFRGEYMSQYSWAENTCGLLWRKET